MKTKESAYKESGVDIEAGAEVVDRIRPLVESTFRDGVMGGLGGFGAFFDLKKTNYKDPVLVSATDGVGTKIRIAIDTNQHHTIGIDLVAMCVNDLVVQGGEPLFFLDYFACGKLNPAVTEQVIAGVAEGCKQAGCALIGGETAEMPGMYNEGDYDLAGFAVGAVERDNIIKGDKVEKGDIVLGIASSGAHSNGYSLIRRLVKTTQGFSWNNSAPFQPGVTMGEAFLTPTRIYVRPLLKALKEEDSEGTPVIRAMAHITGGGLTENIPRILPAHLAVTLDANEWVFPPLFKWLRDVGELETGDMAQTLNCGIGMVVICHQDGTDRVKACLEDEGETVYVIGEVVENNGTSPVQIKNMVEAWTS